ncbi:MAG: DUF992 domain-containing protein [Xanthobacteraceae bacterium]|nr:DUF992 domain-containing protein [Xanthobacteraceae bacterium]
MRRLFAILSAVTLIASFAIAHAQQNRVQAGTLECRGGASVGLIVGSVTNLGCVFRSPGHPDDLYVATISKIGVDLGITETTALAWAVFAPTVQLGPGALSGNYGGVDASAAIGLGLGANVMVGGSANSYAFQPLSVQGQTGLNVAGGIQGMQLRPGR